MKISHPDPTTSSSSSSDRPSPPGRLIKSFLSAAVFSILILAGGFFAGRSFLSMRVVEPIFPADGLTTHIRLSHYFSPLRNTPGDAEVFVFQGTENGGTVLITGGTHPNEPAGYIAAVVLIENLEVSRGRVIIVPRVNTDGFTHSDPQEGSPQRFTLETPGGPRIFRLGSRVTNPIHQWPDPTFYITPGGQKLAGLESRNLNRAYPGKASGNLTERIAFGIMELIRTEKVDLGIDLHESAPEYPVINALVFHESAAELAAVAQMELESLGYEFRLEASPPNLRGLSHREWGDSAGIKAVLLETPNASHGRLKGRPSASLVIDGRDRYYEKAAALGRLFVPFGPEGIPLKHRVARHIAGITALLGSLSGLEPEKTITTTGLPAPSDLETRGLGAFLHPPDHR